MTAGTAAPPRIAWRDAMLPASPRRRVALLPLLALAAMVALGSAVRLTGLERAPLALEELNHFYVARSLQRGEAPALPSGEWYLRGMDYTRVVGLTLDRVQPVERAVRLPSALFGCIALVFFAAIAWRMAAPWVAVYAGLLLALYPQAIHLSRIGRFYTLQLVYGLVAFYAGWRALTEGAPPVRNRDALLRTWGWTLLATAALLLAARMQVVTLSVGLAWAVAMATKAVLDVRSAGWASLRWSVPLQATAVAVLGGVLWLVARPDAVTLLLARAFETPSFVNERVNYLSLMVANLPLVAALGGASLFWVARRRRALGLYLLVWFALPLLLHSFLPWRASRFVLLAVPALFLAVAIAVTDLFTALQGAVAAWLTRRQLNGRMPRFAVTAASVVLALSALTPTPALTHAVWPPISGQVHGWNKSREIISALPEGKTIPLGHVMPLAALHYWGRIELTVHENAHERWLTQERKRSELGIDEPGGYVRLPPGAPDFYTGAPVLTTPDVIREHFARAGAVLIGTNSLDPLAEGMRAELYEMLQAEATELCMGRCGPMLLYFWRFYDEDGKAGEGTTS